MGGVEGVDEGVHAGAVSAVGNERGLAGAGAVGVELGGVLVELEVPVGGVVRVDEGVGVGVGADGGLGGDLLKLGGGGSLADLLDGRSGAGSGTGSGGGLDDGGGGIGGTLLEEGGGVLAGGGDVVAAQDPEAVLAGRVLDNVGLTVLANVGVLSDPVAVDVGLLLEDDTVLGGEGRSGAAVAGVKALLLKDLGQLGVHVLGGAQRHGTSENNLREVWPYFIFKTTFCELSKILGNRH